MGDYTPPPQTETPPAVIIGVGAGLGVDVDLDADAKAEGKADGGVQAVQEGQLVGDQEEEGEAEGTTAGSAGVEVAEDPIVSIGLDEQ